MTNNELIARFMGYSEEAQKNDLWCRDFHENWSALMPVVAKIESLGYETAICNVVIKGERLTEVLLTPEVKDNKIEIHVRDSKPKIEVVYQAVVDLIKCL